MSGFKFCSKLFFCSVFFNLFTKLSDTLFLLMSLLISKSLLILSLRIFTLAAKAASLFTLLVSFNNISLTICPTSFKGLSPILSNNASLILIISGAKFIFTSI